ncbi:hypothetical protein AB4Y87_03605 [Paenarthrobacter sp. RAF54_2]
MGPCELKERVGVSFQPFNRPHKPGVQASFSIVGDVDEFPILLGK